MFERQPALLDEADTAEHAGTLVFDVFASDARKGSIGYLGSLCAPDPNLAQLYAERLFGRRGEHPRLWVVKRSDEIRVSTTRVSVRPPRERT